MLSQTKTSWRIAINHGGDRFGCRSLPSQISLDGIDMQVFVRNLATVCKKISFHKFLLRGCIEHTDTLTQAKNECVFCRYRIC